MAFKEISDLSNVVMDILDFLPADDKKYVQKYQKFKPDGADTAVTLDGEHAVSKDTQFQNDMTHAFVKRVLSTPNSTLQMNLTSAVNTTANQTVTMYTAVEHLVAKVEADRVVKRAVVLTAAGGDKPAPGCVGIRFFGTLAEEMKKDFKAFYRVKTGETMPDFYTKEEQKKRAEAAAAATAAAADAGDDAADADGAEPKLKPQIHFILKQVARLLFVTEQECLAVGNANYRPCWQNSALDRTFEEGVDDNVKLNHLALLFLVLRCADLFPEVCAARLGGGVRWLTCTSADSCGIAYCRCPSSSTASTCCAARCRWSGGTRA